MATLEYEPTDRARPIVVEREEGVTKVIVKMVGLYAPVPGWVGQMGEISLIVAPIWWVIALVVRTALGMRAPPRGVFEFRGELVTLEVRDWQSGEVKKYQWPKAGISEMRANRYERGFWVDVPGQMKETIFPELPKEVIEKLEEALRQAMATEGKAGNSQASERCQR